MTTAEPPLGPGTPGYGHLFGVAYRLLGSAQDAEDAVQDGLIRWHLLAETDRELIREPLAWLTRVVSRICLDMLGSARARREQYAGTWLPEPLPGDSPALVSDATAAAAEDPADAVTRDESVSLALLVVMEELSPGERVALVLHDVFGVEFTTIAAVLDTSSTAARKLASRARIKVASPATIDRRRDQEVVDAFMAAARGGDLERLLQLLAPDALVDADAAAVAAGTPGRIAGQQAVAAFFDGSAHAALPVLVDDRAGYAWYHRGVAVVVFDFAVVDGVVAGITFRADPEVLAAVRRRPVTSAAPDTSGQ